MNQIYYKTMLKNLTRLLSTGALVEKNIYIFGHCNASEELVSLLTDRGFQITAILDNNPSKQGLKYNGIPIIAPEEIIKYDMSNMLVFIVSRAYESMAQQLKQLGYSGHLKKLVEYNTFSEYSLSKETIVRKKKRVARGIQILEKIREDFNNNFFVICPYAALGDVYYTMSYLPYYLRNRNIQNYVVVTVGRACADVLKMFACSNIESLNQQDMDELVQAVLFTRAQDTFIAHHDRPYTNLLVKALYIKFISFETMYRCGVFCLPQDYRPYAPTNLKVFSGKKFMKKNKSVILAPDATSVAGVPYETWLKIISYYNKKEYQIYTNVVGDETELPGTFPLKTELAEFQSAVEWAGIFIGIRSGLCDIIKNADCRKIVLYPDCYYSDTQWKTADFFHLEGWENIVVYEEQ